PGRSGTGRPSRRSAPSRPAGPGRGARRSPPRGGGRARDRRTRPSARVYQVGRGRLGHVAAIDIAGFVSELKDHAIDHGFHVHDERHFVETYSLRQTWEVDLHPEEACGGPLDLHLALEVDPRALLSFEDVITGLPEDEDPPDTFHFPLVFNWALPPLPTGPDLLILATELTGSGGTTLPLEVAYFVAYPSFTIAPMRSLAVVARIEVSLSRVFLGQEQMCVVPDTCLAVSRSIL